MSEPDKNYIAIDMACPTVNITPDQLKRVLFIGEDGFKLAEMIFASCTMEQQGDTLKIWVTEET